MALRCAAFVPTDVRRRLSWTERRRLEIEASAEMLGTGFIASHRSAAVLLGVPILRREGDPVHLRATTAAGTPDGARLPEARGPGDGPARHGGRRHRLHHARAHRAGPRSDGLKKYREAETLSGRSPGEVVSDEKVREDRLRATADRPGVSR